MAFSGIPAEAFEFYDELMADNTRAWWQRRKGDYERYVREPLAALLAELAGEFGQAHMFRPHRDTRFSKDKSPLKEHQGGFVETQDAIGYYVQISAAGLMTAGGWYAPRGQQTARFREAIMAGHAEHLRSMIATLGKQGWAIEGRPLKTRPRGIAADHPDLDLLRMRALTGSKDYDVEPWMGTAGAAERVGANWRELRPLIEWLSDHVGPAEDPPAEAAPGELSGPFTGRPIRPEERPRGGRAALSPAARCRAGCSGPCTPRPSRTGRRRPVGSLVRRGGWDPAARRQRAWRRGRRPRRLPARRPGQ